MRDANRHIGALCRKRPADALTRVSFGNDTTAAERIRNVRCFYARGGCFLNRVRKFDSCRGHDAGTNGWVMLAGCGCGLVRCLDVAF